MRYWAPWHPKHSDRPWTAIGEPFYSETLLTLSSQCLEHCWAPRSRHPRRYWFHDYKLHSFTEYSHITQFTHCKWTICWFLVNLWLCNHYHNPVLEHCDYLFYFPGTLSASRVSSGLHWPQSISVPWLFPSIHSSFPGRVSWHSSSSAAVSLPRCLHWALLLPSLPLHWPLEARAHGSSVDWKDRTLEPQTCICIVTMRPPSSRFVSLNLGFLLCKADTIHMACWVWQLEMMCAVSRTGPTMLSK